MRRIHPLIITRNFIRDFAENRATRKRYRSWLRASKAAKSDYQAEVLTRFRAKRSQAIVGHEEDYVRPVAELIEIMSDGSGAFVDFGGSAGESCSVLHRKFPAMSFVVIETPAMVKAAAKLRPLIAFSSELPDRIDIFYSSGTFQYLEDPYALWKHGLSKTTGYAFLARNTFSETEQFRVQHSMLFNNGAGPIPEGFKDVVVRYPHRTISERRLIDIASGAGFELVNRIADRDGGLIQGAKGMYGADLLFKRR
ncbi:hypothetical protein HFN62_08350 [Rhizobium leguminosarum]|nr:hypothetical protein [Rhizobium leguminosarum]